MPADAPTEVAFELRATVKDLSGLTCAGPNGETVDVKAEMDKNGGQIVTGDPVLIDTLRGIEALKEVAPAAASGGSKAAASTSTPAKGE